LGAGGGLGGDALLGLGGALRSAAGPLAQAAQLARLGEDEQRENGDTEQGGERSDRADLRDFAR
jgi:hypothetical protein